jgi:hypothetical protein
MRKVFNLAAICCLSIVGSLVVSVPAHAGSITADGVTLEWKDPFIPTSCTRVNFRYTNNGTTELQWLNIDVLNKYGDYISADAEFGIAPGASGIIRSTMCKPGFHGTKGYTIEVDVRQRGSGSSVTEGTFKFKKRKGKR